MRRGVMCLAKTEAQIKEEIKSYIKKCGGNYPTWYVGISEDPRDRLFNQHNVDEKNDYWIFRTASSTDVARRIERYFVDILGTDGGLGGGDVDARAVYAYKKKAHTDP